MATWKLKTEYGTIECQKGRSFGQFVWKKPAPEKIFKTAFFSESGVSLDSDVYAHINGKWIPARGNDQYAKKIFYKDWEAMGKPKTIEGKKVGIVVQKVSIASGKSVIGTEADLVWDAKSSLKITKVHLHRFVSKDMKYIIPLPADIELYKRVNKELNKKGEILLTKPIRLMKNSATTHKFAILPIGTHLCYVELLDEDLAKPFPPDALIPSENTEEISSFEDEGEGLI